MRAGAHDFLCKPVNENDLRAAAEKVFKLKEARKEHQESGGKVVAVFSNKGGNGTTTIAVNLADALVRYHGKKVVVVDLALASGDVTMFFNVNPAYSILDLAKNAEKADSDFLHTLLLKHSSGVYILADPPMIEDGESISAGQVREMLSTLRSMFDVIIIDTSHQFDERTLTALEVSDIVLLVTLLNLPSLKSTQKCLELFGRIGFPRRACPPCPEPLPPQRRDPAGESRRNHEMPGILRRAQRLPHSHFLGQPGEAAPRDRP